jgi:hypothetical protein
MAGRASGTEHFDLSLSSHLLGPSILALPRRNDSRWQRDRRRYSLELSPRSSMELRA